MADEATQDAVAQAVEQDVTTDQSTAGDDEQTPALRRWATLARRRSTP
ncbi:hypothetical protein GCM10025864_39510 [Luteimicrobium album]|uniref:Uncharacterized protein n=1 Tax=Luteimicrobium album TaxID=1054550 RepID=A0ABQ6I7I5_9MICO|nr:hypothetical protein [Luteimicrobium album]GMA26192.1 hypothetical protein GCM10025864_39510 [Luteimicrobium album]